MKQKIIIAQIVVALLLLTNNLFAQNVDESKLRFESDNWIEYAVPNFVRNTTPQDNGTPHYTRYDFESTDKKVKIFVLVNNSTIYKFSLRNRYNSLLTSKDLRVTYKSFKGDKFFISGDLSNGNTLYEFCKVKNGYGYTYSIEYEKSYSAYFDKYLPHIIQRFKILF